MKARVLDEPALEFRAGNRHEDPRYGIVQFGPADADTDTAPRRVTVGIVGSARAVEGLRRWLDKCASPIGRKVPKPGQENLFIEFPGFNVDSGFLAELVHSDGLVREIANSDIRRLAAGASAEAVERTASSYADEARSLSEVGQCQAIFVIRPEELDTADMTDGGPIDENEEEEKDEATHSEDDSSSFHDIIKAKSLGLSCPVQVIREETWTGKRPANSKREGSLQDEASRAWNLFTALYYKAGGTPWRLPRSSTDLVTCYVGVSFYRTRDGSSLHTAVAQIFNQRGDGVVVRGGQASVSKDDRQPHLSVGDSKKLVIDALTEFKLVHKHMPARLVVHKSSAFNCAEREGFGAGAEEKDLSQLELIWVQKDGGPRLFRSGQLPPLRCSVLELQHDAILVYTRGSIPFFRTYPGLYVPSPILLRSLGDVDLVNAAVEVLGLSKMNWNNAQLDEREPLTLRTARRVGSILKHVASDQPFATRYAYYM
jgi:hypothetical protein